MLQLKHLSIEIQNKPIIKDFTYTFEKGKIYALMGPNGSGKSTLANGILGHPAYAIHGSIKFKNKEIHTLETEKRVNMGLFLTFQSPLALSGVSVFELMQSALTEQKNISQISTEIHDNSAELAITPELLKRSLNDGASGGERKKLELLQMSVMEPKVIIFDEIDTGLDVDALRIVTRFMQKQKHQKTYIIITHYNRILKYIKPDRVLVLNNGELVKEGDHSLVRQIEKKGYVF